HCRLSDRPVPPPRACGGFPAPQRQAGETTAALERRWAETEPALKPGQYAILSGATGAEPATAEERAFLAARGDVPIRATGTHIGHGVEAQFPMNVALATL